MIYYKESTVKKKEVDYVICDRCNMVVESNNIFELQEMKHIKFRGGYGSVFGDGTEVEFVVCQHCLKEMISDFI